MNAVRPLGFVAGDFRSNGLLLPACEAVAMRDARPLHRGPHPRYSEMVMERVAQIEASFAASHRHAHDVGDAHYRLRLLQRALRRTLDGPSCWVPLNRRDPMGRNTDFTALDDAVDMLWEQSSAPF